MENHSQDDSVQSIINRLQRIEGQVRGIQRMVQDGREGAEVLTQISAVLAALRRVAGAIASRHLEQYLGEENAAGDGEVAAKVQAMIDAFSRLD